ncbi:D-erythro-7,8-dihydroneopterin triphosphate epimerase [Pokkaliibacter plantistimulans]|uniref:Dihydroneopterin triphosphate 2'-epimerase n=1 Tax=Pokkaliibacter plantistimulans TaxID=1635171 RepID=A0ABX5M3Z6_9GAMM|nr:dihydroneopterin triphosphate 2'-epimerase [Pokkaliibacter plantistimulans]PXF32705.1 D-erythro-7,8-dihydroneopterin triphosphate epimerase [Pokkaliibacter plantistimulans]
MSSQSYQLEPATIRIKNLRLRTYIGIKEEEINNRQDVVINVRIRYDAERAASSDDMDNALNYRTITKAIIHYVEEHRFHLLEKLCQEVLDIALTHRDVLEAWVEIDKPHALRFADSVSMELHGRRY